MIRPPRAASTMAATMFLDYSGRVGRSVRSAAGLDLAPGVLDHAGRPVGPDVVVGVVVEHEVALRGAHVEAAVALDEDPALDVAVAVDRDDGARRVLGVGGINDAAEVLGAAPLEGPAVDHEQPG